MANTIDNTFKKIGNTIENILGGGKIQQPSSNASIGGKQTCLEKFGIEARKEHISRNDWRTDFQYTKALVDSEYMVQNEFQVGNTQASVQEQAERTKKKQAEKDAKTAAKQKTRENKKAKKEAEIQKPIEERNAPVIKTTQEQAAIDIMSDPNIARQYFMGR